MEEDEFIDGIIQLQMNKLMIGIIDLERLCDQDMLQDNIPKKHIKVEQIEKINLGMDKDPKYILIGKTYQGKIREDIIKSY